jgi:7-cyano-7-deazaguanine synthase
MPRDVVVLVSGGLDSMVLVEKARREERLAAGIHFIYPHPAQSYERRAVIALRRRLHLQRDSTPVLDVDLPLRASELGIGPGKPGPRVVPARNLVMLAHAANIAASIGAKEVWIGATATDCEQYPDCRPAYLLTASSLCEPFGVGIRAPYSNHPRADVQRLADEWGIDRSWPWSCYQPVDGAPCGSCDSCRQG